MLYNYAKYSKMIDNQVKQYFPGPYTLILNRKKNDLSNLVYLDYTTIGVRIPRHKFPIKVVELLNKPIITTSVNIHNEESLNTFNDIKNKFKNISIFFDRRLKHKSLGSTIIDYSSKPYKVLRKGDGLI